MAVRKWIPPQTRALVTSYSRSLTVSKWRPPSPVRLGMVKSMRRVPRYLAIARPIPVVAQACALGYSGWFGVAGRSGNQLGSATVSGLPSVSQARIEVTGRQNAKRYMASKQEDSASDALNSIIGLHRDGLTTNR